MRPIVDPGKVHAAQTPGGWILLIPHWRKSGPACRSKGPEAEMSGPFDFAEVTFGDP
jgi:hypothetical protein